jgi:hypothetical protein
MNLFELLFFVVSIAIGICLARALYPIGGIWLSVPGFIAGALFIPSLFFAYLRYRRWAYLGDKWMPDCSCGSAEYKYERIEEQYRLICQQCGASYEKHGNKVSVIENGIRKPYKRLMKYQGWV